MKNMYSLNGLNTSGCSIAENRLVFKQPPENINRGPEKEKLPPELIRDCDKKFNKRFEEMGKMTKNQLDNVVKVNLMPKILEEKLKIKIKGYDEYMKEPMFQKSFAVKKAKILEELKKLNLKYQPNDVKNDTKQKFLFNVFEEAKYNPLQSSDEGVTMNDARTVVKLQKNLASQLNGKVNPPQKIKEIAENSIPLAKTATEKACSDAVYTQLDTAMDQTISRIWNA